MANRKLKGFIATFSAFMAWGVLVIYWSGLFHLPPPVIVAYRVLFSFLFVTLIISFSGKWSAVLAVLKSRETLGLSVIAGILIGLNWTVYIIAIANERMLEASMGYYINPFVVAVFGMIFFKEIPSKLQKIALFVALTGVVYMIAGYGQIPVYAIVLSVSFACYGAVHKRLKISIYEGMFFEMAVLILPALIVLWLLHPGFMTEPLIVKVLILFSGPVTILPLVGFAYGVQRLNLTTVGIVQYASPTATFLLGLFYFHEPARPGLFIVFSFIWVGVLIYLADAFLKNRGK